MCFKKGETVLNQLKKLIESKLNSYNDDKIMIFWDGILKDNFELNGKPINIKNVKCVVNLSSTKIEKHNIKHRK